MSRPTIESRIGMTAVRRRGRAYRDQVPLAELEQRDGIDRKSIYNLARRHGWLPRAPHLTRKFDGARRPSVGCAPAITEETTNV